MVYSSAAEMVGSGSGLEPGVENAIQLLMDGKDPVLDSSLLSPRVCLDRWLESETEAVDGSQAL